MNNLILFHGTAEVGKPQWLELPGLKAAVSIGSHWKYSGGCYWGLANCAGEQVGMP